MALIGILALTASGAAQQGVPVSLAPVGVPSQSRHAPAVSDRAVARLQRLVKVRYREARDAFIYSGEFNDDGALDNGFSPEPFLAVTDRWNRRLAACADNRCRLRELSQQLGRFNFALGYAPAIFPAGVPLRTGSLASKEPGIWGGVTILPVEDGTVLVAITTDHVGRNGLGGWDCAWISASGTLAPNGPGRMFVANQDKPISFDLRILGVGTVRVAEDVEDRKQAAADPDWPPVCSTGPIFGIFRGKPIPRKTG